MYGLLLLVTVIISCIMLAPGVRDLLTKVPFCEESPTLISRLLEGKNFSLFYFNYLCFSVAKATLEIALDSLLSP